MKPFLLLVLAALSVSSFAAGPLRELTARRAFCNQFLIEWEEFESYPGWDETGTSPESLKRAQAVALIERMFGEAVASDLKKQLDAKAKTDTVDDIISKVSTSRKAQSHRAKLVAMKRRLDSRDAELSEDDIDEETLDPYLLDVGTCELCTGSSKDRNEFIKKWKNKRFGNGEEWIASMANGSARLALIDLAQIYRRFLVGRPEVLPGDRAGFIQYYAEYTVVKAINSLDNGFFVLFNMITTRNWNLKDENWLSSAKENNAILATLMRMVFVYEMFYPGSIEHTQKYMSVPIVPWLVSRLTDTEDNSPYGVRYSVAMLLNLIFHREMREGFFLFVQRLQEGMTGADLEDIRKLSSQKPAHRSVPAVQEALAAITEQRRKRGDLSESIAAYEMALENLIDPRLANTMDKDSERPEWAFTNMSDAQDLYLEIRTHFERAEKKAR